METSNHGTMNMRILVVEDNFLIAEALSDALKDAGFTVLGPVANVQRGKEMLGKQDLDGAVLDVNLGAEYCFPIALKLKEKGIPFLFLTGYDDSSLIPHELRDVDRFSKPVDFDVVIDALRDRIRPAQ